MASSKETDPPIVAEIKGIDDIRAMGKLMEDLEIPTKGLKTIEEMKTRTMDFISTEKKKARDWSSGEAFSVLTKAKDEDAKKRRHLLDFYNQTGTLLKSKMDEQMLTLLEKHTKEVQENMEQHVKQLEPTEYSLLVAGETSSGKSSLLNLILGEEIFPYSLLNTTSTICELKFASDCRMVVHFKDKDPETGQKTKSIPLDKKTASDKISSFVHKMTGRKRSTDIKKIELFWDHEVLKKGIVIIDSPGVGESREMDEMVVNYLPKAFAFIYVINSYDAGGIQERLVDLLKRSKSVSIGDHQGDGKNGTEQTLFSKCALFVCNKWDLVSENESQEVKNDSIHQLKDVFPGVDSESQIIFMSIERAKIQQKYGVIREKFLSLMDGMKSVILNSIEARLELHWIWLYKLLSRISVQAKLFVTNGSRGSEEVTDASSSTEVMANASNSPEGMIKASKRPEDEKNASKSPEEVVNALRNPEEIDERMEKIVHRLKEIEKDEKKIIKDFHKLFNDQVNSVVQRLSKHLSSDNIKARFTSWSLDEAPDENGSWDEVEEKVNNVLCSRFYEIVEQWEEDNKVFANANLLLMQKFRDYYDDVEFQLQNLQSEAAGDDISKKSGKGAFNFRFSSDQKLIWTFKIFFYGVTSYIDYLILRIVRKGLKKVHGTAKYLYRDLLLGVSSAILAASKDEKKLKSFVEGKLNEAKLFLDHLEARLPELIEADRKLYELLRKEKTERSRYKTIWHEVEEQRKQLSRFGITEVCAVKIEPKELDWKEHGSSYLGSGNFAAVYQGTLKRDGKDGTAVAVKVWNDELDNNNAIEIMEEIKHLRMLNHPHIVQFYGISLKMDRTAVVMEKCKGNLKKHIFNSPQAVPSKTENSTVFKDVCRWAKEISDGLAYIHAKGVVHRDLKLQNILLSEENTVKIADVGMAKAEIDITGTFAGTPIYMAPEVFHHRVYGTMADIYSLGLIMWEMWYGRRVFADAPTTTLPEFFNWVDEGNRPVEMQGCKSPPSFWEQLMKQCWDGNPVKRPIAKECHERMIRMIESVSPESSV